MASSCAIKSRELRFSSRSIESMCFRTSPLAEDDDDDANGGCGTLSLGTNCLASLFDCFRFLPLLLLFSGSL
jgi:hypothetical protein